MCKVKDELERAEVRDSEYYYFMGRTDTLSRILTIATNKFTNNQINSDCFTSITNLVDEIIKADDES